MKKALQSVELWKAWWVQLGSGPRPAVKKWSSGPF